ncbi:amidase signature enzyme [Hymenopellis radicata]|nr:amidase signature enzyme [Hymenopellis radicata]
MGFWASSSVLERVCAVKKTERQRKIESLAVSYSAPLTPSEKKIHDLSLTALVSRCRSGELAPSDVMRVYGKRTLLAQQESNCLTDILVDEALSSALAHWGPAGDSDGDRVCNARPLLGVPISVKDSIDIRGHDTTIGLARNCNQPAATSSAIVRLLQDAGALIHAKTTVPTALFAMETESDVFGRTTNPYNRAYGVGASTGGGGAVVSWGGSKIEIGSDVAGSVRIPAHTCGLWSLKGSVGRFPSLGNHSSMPGFEAVPILVGPLASSLDDLQEFYQRVIQMEPWTYDHTCVPLQWRPINFLEEGRRLKWGVIWTDHTIPPSPACKRALSTVAEALRSDGHEVVDFSPPILEVLGVGYQLFFADAGSQIFAKLLPNERLNDALMGTLTLIRRSRFVKSLYRLWGYITGRPQPEAPEVLCSKTIVEERELVIQRDALRDQWHQQWTSQGLDFVLTVTHPFPALANGDGAKASLMSASYTFLFNLLDYAAGVLPVTNVDKELDSLPANFESSAEYQGMTPGGQLAWSTYDAEKMHGLPLSVQIVGRRLEEEKVLAAMRVVEQTLKNKGVVFKAKKDLI